MKKNYIYYMDSSGKAQRGILLEEKNGLYLGRYLIIENSSSKEKEGIFPYDILSEEIWKKNKGKRVNRGRRWKMTKK